MQFEFIINFKTAAALAFAMPPTAPTGRRGARIAVVAAVHRCCWHEADMPI
jgi:hypothetical protein